MQQLEKLARGTRRRQSGGNLVDARPHKDLVVDATLQDGVGELGPHVVIVSAGTAPLRETFETAEGAERNHQPFNVTGFVNAHSGLLAPSPTSRRKGNLEDTLRSLCAF